MTHCLIRRVERIEDEVILEVESIAFKAQAKHLVTLETVALHTIGGLWGEAYSTMLDCTHRISRIRDPDARGALHGHSAGKHMRRTEMLPQGVIHRHVLVELGAAIV